MAGNVPLQELGEVSSQTWCFGMRALRRQFYPSFGICSSLCSSWGVSVSPCHPKMTPIRQTHPHPPFFHPWLQLWSTNLLQCHCANPTTPTEHHFGSIQLPNLLLLVRTPNNLSLGTRAAAWVGWLVGVWLLLQLLRAPGEWMIPKICLFPPGLISSGFVNGKNYLIIGTGRW